MKSPRERVDAILAASTADEARAILVNLLGRLEHSATASAEGSACVPYARRRCGQRSSALWAIAQAEAAAASVAATAAKAGGAT